MNPIWKQSFSVERLKRPVCLMYSAVGIYLAYVLSFGPVLWLCGVTSATGLAGLPSWVRACYAPARALVPDKFNNLYDWYLMHFTRMES